MPHRESVAKPYMMNGDEKHTIPRDAMNRRLGVFDSPASMPAQQLKRRF
jgi:hypothetical protein